MTVATPLSLNNIKYEFGNTKYQTLTSGSGTITAPTGATSLKITLVGAGGGGAAQGSPGGQAGGNGGYLIKDNISVTGGSTSISYSVGSGGSPGYYDVEANEYYNGSDGGQTSITVNSTSYIAYGGVFSGADGGTSNNGDTNTTGGGNNGGALDNFGENGVILLEWAYFARAQLSTMTLGGGFIPNHAQNSNIPTGTSGLSISDFSGASLNFTATITADASDGTGYQSGLYGSIDRDQAGISRSNTDTTIVQAVYQTRGIFYDLFGAPLGYAYATYIRFSGDLRNTTLGYEPFSGGRINEYPFNISVNSFIPASVSYDGSSTTITDGFSYLGSLSTDDWAFQTGSNNFELYYNTLIRYETIGTQTITSGNYPFFDGPGGETTAAPLQAPVGAEAVTVRVWGSGAGGTGGQGGGGGGYNAIVNAPISAQQEFRYVVGVGGAAGVDGNSTSFSANTDFTTTVTAIGGYANGVGGSYSFGFFGDWDSYYEGSANGFTTVTSNGGAAGGPGGGAGGVGAAGSVPGGGGASGYAGARGEIQIEWKAVVPVPGNF